MALTIGTGPFSKQPAGHFDVLRKGETVSQCPYKGDGQHWHVVLAGERITDAAGISQRPWVTRSRFLAGSAFTRKVDVLVDRELIKPGAVSL